MNSITTNHTPKFTGTFKVNTARMARDYHLERAEEIKKTLTNSPELTARLKKLPDDCTITLLNPHDVGLTTHLNPEKEGTTSPILAHDAFMTTTQTRRTGLLGLKKITYNAYVFDENNQKLYQKSALKFLEATLSEAEEIFAKRQRKEDLAAEFNPNQEQ